MSVPTWAQLGLGTLVIAHGLYLLMLHAWAALPSSIVKIESIRHDENICFKVTRRDGKTEVKAIHRDSWITRSFAYITFTGILSPNLFLTLDNCDQNAFRRLRVVLRLSKGETFNPDKLERN